MAQSPTIFGKIVDDTNQPIAYASVILRMETDSSLVKATVALEDGMFTLKDIEAGSYVLQVINMGYKTLETSIRLNDDNLDLGNIVVETSLEELDAVEVIAEKPLVQVLADKTVFNVANTLNAVGDSGFELLRKAPGVMIDNNDNLMVEGKTGVLIYIDDRPSVLRGQDLTNFLKTLQATDIESIEIITQPSSKYDAQGNAGIINIKLKRDKSLGTNGSATAGITVGDYARYNSSLTFNNRNKKTSFYGNYSNNFGKGTGFLNLYRRQNNTIFDAQTDTEWENNSNNLRLGFDYYMNPKSTIGIILNGNFNNNVSDNNTRTPIIPEGTTQPSQVLVAGSYGDNESSNLYANLNYKFKDTLGHSLNIDLDYGVYGSDRSNLQPNRYLNGEGTEVLNEIVNYMVTPIDIDILTTKFDYEQNFLKGILGLGSKYSKVLTDNNFDFYNRIDGEDVLDTDRTNDFTYDEQVLAFYVNFNRSFKKFNFQLGLRMENTRSDGELESFQSNLNDRVRRNYTDWFPSGGMTYQLNQKNSLALIYSRRIERPNYQSLNPFEYKIDELSSRRGNPFLQPQYTDNIKLSHTFNYRLTTSLSYSFIKDYFAQVTEAVNINENFIVTRNVANQKVINLGISYPTKINKWWSIYASLNAYRSIYEATNPDFISISQNTLSLYAQNTFKFPHDYTFEVSGWFSSPSVWGGTYQNESLGSLNLAVQKKFLNEKLTARLSLSDILYTMPWRAIARYGDLSIVGSGGSDSRQVAFSLSYNFGRDDVKKARARDTGLEEEKNRI